MIEQILNQNTSKTAKMRALFELGLTRMEVANLVGVNYGFAHNVYVKMYGTTRDQRIRQNQANQANPENEIWRRRFGIEIEAFGVTREQLVAKLREAGIEVQSEDYNHRTRTWWKIVRDGSIRGENSFELVSPPLKGEDGINQIKRVCEVLVQLNAKVNKSCGFHVHFDAENLTLQTWKNLTWNYYMLEEEIDKMMPPSRRGNSNNYCQSLRTRVENQNLQREIDECQTLMDLSRKMTDRSRYFKLNYESYWRHKTVEFRQHSGTVEFEKISNWIKILNRIINYSEGNRVAESNENALYALMSISLVNYIKMRRQKFGF
jgi:hypothetical protein